MIWCWMNVREIAETVGISKERVGYILQEELDMIKLCAGWVPHLLTADQKRSRMEISEQCLERFNKNKTYFVRWFITMDEMWIHHYTPEYKQKSKQWTEASCSVPKKTRLFPSTGKVSPQGRTQEGGSARSKTWGLALLNCHWLGHWALWHWRLWGIVSMHIITKGIYS